MKSFWFLLRTTITGGIVFFLPILFLWTVGKHAISEITRYVRPLAERMGIATFAGQATVLILVVLLICIVCFLAGLLMRSPRFKNLSDFIDKNIVTLVPGYGQFKNTALLKMAGVGKHKGEPRTLVLLYDQYAWVPALKTEMHNGFCSYFFPSDTSLKSGYVKIMPIQSVREKVIPFDQLENVLSAEGKGVIALIGESNT